MTEKKLRGRQIHVEMPAAEYDAFRALAKEQERTLQGLARLAIRAYMDGVTAAAGNVKFVTIDGELTALRSEFKAPADKEQQ